FCPQALFDHAVITPGRRCVIKHTGRPCHRHRELLHIALYDRPVSSETNARTCQQQTVAPSERSAPEDFYHCLPVLAFADIVKLQCVGRPGTEKIQLPGCSDASRIYCLTIGYHLYGVNGLPAKNGSKLAHPALFSSQLFGRLQPAQPTPSRIFLGGKRCFMGRLLYLVDSLAAEKIRHECHDYVAG